MIQWQFWSHRSHAIQILHRHKFHPYHLSLHQELHGNNFNASVEFCGYAVHHMQNNDLFWNVLVSGEACTNTVMKSVLGTCITDLMCNKFSVASASWLSVAIKSKYLIQRHWWSYHWAILCWRIFNRTHICSLFYQRLCLSSWKSYCFKLIRHFFSSMAVDIMHT
jgi:hypothetical protein